MASRGGYSAVDAEEITEALQQRMQEANELTDSVASVLQVGVDQDMEALDKDLQAFLDGDDTALDVDDHVVRNNTTGATGATGAVPPVPLVMVPTPPVPVAIDAPIVKPKPARGVRAASSSSAVTERVAVPAG
jgi:hypothetical protein